MPFGQGGHDHLVPAGLHQFLAHVPHIGDVLYVVNVQALHTVRARLIQSAIM